MVKAIPCLLACLPSIACAVIPVKPPLVSWNSLTYRGDAVKGDGGAAIFFLGAGRISGYGARGRNKGGMGGKADLGRAGQAAISGGGGRSSGRAFARGRAASGFICGFFAELLVLTGPGVYTE